MPEVPTWEVDLFVDGPVTLRRRFSTTQQKGFALRTLEPKSLHSNVFVRCSQRLPTILEEDKWTGTTFPAHNPAGVYDT
jgi:hypothetical protein